MRCRILSITMNGLNAILLVVQCTLVLAAVNYVPDNPPYVVVHDDTFVPDVILRITTKAIDVDCTTRPNSVVINGTVPGPTLRFREGQKVWIRVYNDMEDQNTTMHWHGLTLRTSPFSDGTPMVSQWPIPPLHYFDYEFQLQPGDAGTHMYHSHTAFQAVTAIGALIVDEPAGKAPPYQYDDEHLIIFTDIYQRTDQVLQAELTGDPFSWTGDPRNIGVNWKARAVSANLSQAGPSCEMGVFNVDPGKAYRIRVIGATAFSYVYFKFEDHNMVLIEVDGRYIMPHAVDHLQVGAGQRYSVLLFTKSLAELTGTDGSIKNRFWMQLENHSPDSDTDPTDKIVTFAILHYNVGTYGPVDTFTLPATPPLVLPNETFAEGWLEDKLQPLTVDPANTYPKLEEITRRIYVNLGQNIVINGGRPVTAVFTSDDVPWFENTPKEPYLVSLYKNNTKYFPSYERALANGGFDPVTTTFPAKIGEVLEIVWHMVGDNLFGWVETHPWHAHGDHYWDAGTGNGTYDPVANEAMLTARHGRVITRDTSNTYRPSPRPEQKLGPLGIYSWRSFRIRVQNPGVWMMHCHSLQHMIMGMQTVWVFGDLKDLTPVPKHMIDEGYLEYGGTAYGNATFAPRVLHYWH